MDTLPAHLGTAGPPAGAGAGAPESVAAPAAVPPAAGDAERPPGVTPILDALTGAELVARLHEVARDGHVPLTYNDARDQMFTTLARASHPSGRVEAVFTGRTIPAVGGRTEAFGQGFNTEHLWPQSLGCRRGLRSDLHQVKPAEVRPNEIRANHPFGSVVEVLWESDPDGAGETSRLGRDASGRVVFEPRESMRGAIARSMMYVATRYGPEHIPGFSAANFAVELDVLLGWNELHPPTERERARSAAATRLQGNVNPFVLDHTLGTRAGSALLDAARGAIPPAPVPAAA